MTLPRGLAIAAVGVWEDGELKRLDPDTLKVTHHELSKAIDGKNFELKKLDSEYALLAKTPPSKRKAIQSVGGLALGTAGLMVGEFSTMLSAVLTAVGFAAPAMAVAEHYLERIDRVAKVNIADTTKVKLEEQLKELYKKEKRIVLVLADIEGKNAVII